MRVENVPDPGLTEPTDAIVRVVRACVCGSDLHPYHSMPASGQGSPMGHEFLGYGVSAHLWLSVAPAELARVGAAIAAHPEVPFAAATTAPNNLIATVQCTDTDSLYRFLTHEIGALPGVHHTDTASVVRTIKRS